LDAHRIDVHCLLLLAKSAVLAAGPVGGKLSSIKTRAVLCALIVS